MDAIGRPVRILVSTRSMGKLYELLAGYIHYKNVKVSRLEPARPCKRYMLAIRIPRWIHRVPFATSQAGDVRAVYIHSIYLRCTSAPRREDDVRAGLRIRLRFHFERSGVGDAMKATAVDVGHENLGDAAGGGGINEQMPVVRHEVGRSVHGRILVQINQLPSRFERVHVDLRLIFRRRMTWGSRSHRIDGKGDFGSIRRGHRECSDGPVGCELLLIGTIVIHGPDLFVASAVGHEVDPGPHETSRPK